MGVIESLFECTPSLPITNTYPQRNYKVLERPQLKKSVLLIIDQNKKHQQTKNVIQSSILGNNEGSTVPISVITTEKTKKQPSAIVVNKGSSGASSLEQKSNGSGYDTNEFPSDVGPINQTILKPIKVVPLKTSQASICQVQSLQTCDSMKVLGQNN